VNDAVVAIGGDVEIAGGQVGDAVVSVGGSVKVDAGSKVHGDAVSVGGTVDVAEGATVEGHTQEVDLGGLGLANLQWFRSWFKQCVLKLRPLAPGVGWVWVMHGMMLLIYLAIAAVFPRPVGACVEEMTRRPATTFLMGLLAKLLVPLVLIILAITVFGLIVVPFIIAALILGLFVGKAALLEWIGLGIGRQFGFGAALKPVGAFLLGAVVITLLYMVPVLGLVAFGVISVWGFGGAVMAAFASWRKEAPEKSAAPGANAMGGQQAVASASAMDAPVSRSADPLPVGTEPLQQPPPTAPAPTGEPPPIGNSPSPIAPVVPDTLAYPKAGFWERMGAAFLDVVLVSLVGHLSHLGLIVALAYFSGMYAWRGTTIGGIVLGLKVVRMDGQPLSFVVALVRALAAAFSVVILFLGFLWIIWDRDKQGWHDKIAGTVVLRLPRGTPLLCL
jgi:uncharacterized RDD family membrane protein YckC